MNVPEPQLPTGELQLISCTSDGACMATSGRDSDVAFTERWDGSSWHLIPIPGINRIAALSCESASSCLAVGDGATVETWNGTSWSVATSPPAANALTLTGVWCRSTGICEVVGYERTPSGSSGPLFTPFAAQWNGSSWTVQSMPAATGSGINFSEPLAVNCPTASSCTAVGYSDDTAPGAPDVSQIPFAAKWNGTSWHVQSVPRHERAQLNSVSCSAGTDCVATGYSYLVSITPAAGFAEHWDGSNWAETPLAHPPTKNFRMQSVSCASATDCLATGGYPQPSPGSLIERWDGSSWSRQSATTLAGASLFGISCLATGNCRTPGLGVRPFVASWDGSAWTRDAVPQLPTQPAPGRFFGISCASATACAAVGDDGFAIAYWWNGSHWVERLRLPAGNTSSSLGGVSCDEPTSCLAVGETTRGLLATRADAAGHWTLLTPAAPPLNAPRFKGVSCVSATSCVAVGFGFTQPGEGILAERWNGSSWTIDSIPNPAGMKNAVLNGVSCMSADDCTAVGEADTGSSGEGLVVHWNGSGWSQVTVPQPAGAQFASLNGVSCATAGSCVAVGLSLDSSFHGSLLVEVLRSGTWALQTISNAGGINFQNGLTGVSCVTSSSCVAVGEVIERWDGSAWSKETAPYPNGSGNTLEAVTCAAGRQCFTAGPGETNSFPLIEQSIDTF